MSTRKSPLNSAPRISARLHPNVSLTVAGRWPSACAASAIRTPPTAENVWNASEITATDPDHSPTTSSTTK